MPRPRSQLHAKIGQRVRQLRQARGLTQFQLGGTIGLSHHFISGIERGVDSPSLDTLMGLARVLGTSVAALVDDDEADPRRTLELDLLRQLKKRGDPRFFRMVGEMIALYEPRPRRRRAR